MYIRKSIRAYKGKTYTNYLLVESVHTAKGPRQRTVCSLGDLSARSREEWLKLACKIEDALIGQGNLLDPHDREVADIVSRVRARRAKGDGAKQDTPPAPPARPGASLIKVDPTRVATERHREAGPVHVGRQFWLRLDLDRILRDCGLSATGQRLACAMALNRLIAPCSEHAMPDWIRRTALADILGGDFEALEEDPLYLVLDKLHPHRDHRADRKQVGVGLVVSREGFPIAHEVFAGNTQDREACIPPGRLCAKPSRPTRSAPSSCRPTTVPVCASERLPPPNPTSAKSIAASPFPRRSSSPSTRGHHRDSD